MIIRYPYLLLLKDLKFLPKVFDQSKRQKKNWVCATNEVNKKFIKRFLPSALLFYVKNVLVI